MADTLFIMENPYISDLFLKTMEDNNFLVLKNELSEKVENYKLNMVNEKDVFCRENLKIYSNSENAISDVIENFKNSGIKEYINVCKDKYEMRKQLKTIYPRFFFKEILLKDLDNVDVSDFPKKFIIKPSIGFLSMGVHKVNSKSEWRKTVELIKTEISDFKKNFPESVLNSSKFIIEEVIEGEEFAVDVYFNDIGEPVILNIFKHPFVSEDDVSDRVYISSKEIIAENLDIFEKVLSKIGGNLRFKNFPVHIELIKRNDNAVIPVEINPMRFAGWCTTDLAYFAYEINIYEYFAYNKKPNWEKILKEKEDKIFYFAMAETPPNIDKTKINFNYEKLKTCFSKILDFRKIDFTNKPMFAVIFGETKNKSEINKILELNMNDFISYQ